MRIQVITIFVLSIMLFQTIIAKDFPSRPQESKGDVLVPFRRWEIMI